MVIDSQARNSRTVGQPWSASRPGRHWTAPLPPRSTRGVRLVCALTTALLWAGAAAAADPVAWRVVYVADGDTITCLDETNKQHRIRIDGIDAPERGQPFGTVARDRMIALAKGRTATVHAHGNDRYGRVLATVEIAGDDLGRRLGEEGLAWRYVQFNNDQRLAAAEKAAGRGLWGDPKPVPPWEWRKSEKRR